MSYHRSGAISTMATLNPVGAYHSVFFLLLSSRLYKTFVCPKFEYGLAISVLCKKGLNEELTLVNKSGSYKQPMFKMVNILEDITGQQASKTYYRSYSFSQKSIIILYK
ncbi:hypothetical protein PHYBLDRAFT_73868 [Phycomyces blakesleeanus NRRL 1555(-)]|uniref:Uncharacterized protein n=1 Tax=Phycomyces blakesleeanus (strain ATCC 8743b / DSM 1359 / FGSC 10004 / NBRC 33097 / NRRL 1555) TaxID=763407 RepID=A0A162PGE6_PHYB8|nr:hypothetical protein PHYBLDRAFT_73868 [Phycomyces blakesleeanus NRRL 1555(-)]OAD65456.1 hypothetical protein PHYBLDRAFT_73868 [Phycomyces blakesleeanus NRRL 1555(-)]|eukprot:XP_018283496.1 hypothetical protein PHYBLDRAFT_73868 [Phycomyces blakesleeanus NRRL 1555(-)]